MRCGRLRHRVSWYRATRASGVPTTETLTLFGTFPCAIEPTKASDVQALGGTTGYATAKITMRYVRNFRSDLVGYYNGRRYEIVSPPIDPDERHRELQILVRERT